MTKQKKLQDKFLKNPESLSLREIEKILESLGFTKIPAKGSHIKWKHPELYEDIIIPVHHNDCKSFYKKKVYKVCKSFI